MNEFKNKMITTARPNKYILQNEWIYVNILCKYYTNHLIAGCFHFILYQSLFTAMKAFNSIQFFFGICVVSFDFRNHLSSTTTMMQNLKKNRKGTKKKQKKKYCLSLMCEVRNSLRNIRMETFTFVN